jgi:hypothetical protein
MRGVMEDHNVALTPARPTGPPTRAEESITMTDYGDKPQPPGPRPEPGPYAPPKPDPKPEPGPYKPPGPPPPGPPDPPKPPHHRPVG